MVGVRAKPELTKKALLVVGCAGAEVPHASGQYRTGGMSYSTLLSLVAAALTTFPQVSQGRGPRRSTGPDTESTASTWPAESVIGADTLARPISRSATDSAR